MAAGTTRLQKHTSKQNAKADPDIVAFTYHEPHPDPQTNFRRWSEYGSLLGPFTGSENTRFVHIYTPNPSESVWRAHMN